MSKKIPKQVVIDEIISDDLWDMDLEEMILADLSHEFNEDMNRSWRWYMMIDRYKSQGWAHIVISSDHKNKTVANWLTENKVEFQYEGQEFLINDAKMATITALKFA